MSNHVYINKKLVHIGDCEIEQREEPDKYEVKIQTADWAESPHCDTDEIVYFGNVRDYVTDDKIENLRTEDDKGVDDFDGFKSFLEALNKSTEYKYYIVYSYIHSGVWLTLERPTCRWDGGIFAIARVKRCDTEKETDEAFVQDFKQMQAWYAGSVYEICIYNELGNFEDSVGPFYGDEDLKSYIDDIDEYYGIPKEGYLAAYNNR